MASLRDNYLMGYNAVQFSGWVAVLLFSLPLPLMSGPDFLHQLSLALTLTGLFQAAALLEVLHALLGLVRGGWSTAFLQWAGRSHVLFCVAIPLTQLHSSPALILLLLSWSASEVIRYPWYFLTISGGCPGWLTWLRYSAFIILYPLGEFGGEIPLMYHARPLAEELGLYGGFFKYLPFDYSQFLLGLLVIYPLMWLQLYVYMFKQRSSKLRPQSKKNH